MRVALHLAPETERVLRENAARSGRTLEVYLQELADREAKGVNAVLDDAPADSGDFERGLDELSEGLEGLPRLPADFSRADVYGEHP